MDKELALLEDEAVSLINSIQPPMPRELKQFMFDMLMRGEFDEQAIQEKAIEVGYVKVVRCKGR